jgi:hypothetical protein
MKIVFGSLLSLFVCGLLLALIVFSPAIKAQTSRTIARVEIQVPQDWTSSPTYCVVSNGQGFSQYGWAQNGSTICIAGFFISPGTYHVTTYHAGKWTQPQPIAEILDGHGVSIQPAGNSFSLPASSYTVNVIL